MYSSFTSPIRRSKASYQKSFISPHQLLSSNEPQVLIKYYIGKARTTLKMSASGQAGAFDPYTQNFTLLMADGITAFQVGVHDLDEYVLYNTQVGINYASQVGASIVMLVVVLLVTRESKRRSTIFVINVISLVLSIIRSLLQILYWVGPFTETYAYFSGDYSFVPHSAYANSIASILMTLLFLCTIEVSLVFQTRVVCTTLRDRYRVIIMAISLLITLLTIGFRFADMVENAVAIVGLETTYNLTWLASAALIMETISIWFFCLIFVGKLGITLYQRKKLGLRQWGPMQIICIMGGCTMVIPCKLFLLAVRIARLPADIHKLSSQFSSTILAQRFPKQVLLLLRSSPYFFLFPRFGPLLPSTGPRLSLNPARTNIPPAPTRMDIAVAAEEVARSIGRVAWVLLLLLPLGQL
jgi:pheromone alpha factor receptor